jgi:two-component system, LuxR family, response regulator FixJ
VSTHARKPVVFVVEDDDSVRKSMGRLIRAEGFDVRLFESSERFLDEVTEMPTACVILDIAMPHISGLNVQNLLSERGIRMPVIVVSARDDDATRREAKQAGAKFFFRKPVDDRTLFDAIDWAVNSDLDESTE